MSTAIPSASSSQLELPGVAPRLLVSVRSGHEAQMAVQSGVEWVDLKNPDAGSLGAADQATAAAVAETLHFKGGSAERISSAAVGELRDAPTTVAVCLAGYFPLLKVGLSGLRDSPIWPEQLGQLYANVRMAGADLVPVIYADHLACHAPAPAQVIEVASTLQQWSARTLPARLSDNLTRTNAGTTDLSGPRYMLIDTFTKDGRRLLDWMSPAALESIVRLAAASGRQTVVAGSLALQDLPHLMSLPIAAIAIRGAVCAGDRRSGLCPERLRQWVEVFSAR